jgi:hypothetical protein
MQPSPVALKTKFASRPAVVIDCVGTALHPYATSTAEIVFVAQNGLVETSDPLIFGVMLMPVRLPLATPSTWMLNPEKASVGAVVFIGIVAPETVPMLIVPPVPVACARSVPPIFSTANATRPRTAIDAAMLSIPRRFMYESFDPR